MNAPSPQLSLVTTLFKSGHLLPEFYSRASQALAAITPRYEIILVNDGSPDNSLEVAVALQKADSRLVVVDLSRNFGQHPALLTGLAESRGETIFLLESDLEELPEWVADFHQALQKDPSLDVVYGVQAKRRGAWFERWSGQIFYSLFNALSETKIPANHITCRIMSRRYALALLQFGERELFLGGIYSAVGFKQAALLVNKLQRTPTTYSTLKKLALAGDALSAFSSVPFVVMLLAGFTLSLVSAFSLVILGLRASFHHPTPGWAWLAASLWFVGGMLMASLGTLGFYVKKALVESKQRPRAIIREIYGSAR